MLTFVVRPTGLEFIILNEVIQTHQNKCFMHFIKCGNLRKMHLNLGMMRMGQMGISIKEAKTQR